MGALAETKKVQAIARPQTTFKDILHQEWHKISAVIPKQVSQERMFQLAVSAYNQTPELAKCTPVSVLSCILKCAALGVEPSAVDNLGRAYILPYNNRKTGCTEAQMILGYKGMIDLARRSGEIQDISARAVYEGDFFEYEFGLNEQLKHIPAQDNERTPNKLTHVYMVCHFKDGGHYIDVMTRSQVNAIRSRSKSGSSAYSPWSTDYEAMACKTVIRRAFKFLPVSVEAQKAAATDEATPTISNLFTPPQYTVDQDTGEVLDESSDSTPEEKSEATNEQ